MKRATELAAVNGKIFPLVQASLSVLDLGLLRGAGAFDTLRTYGGHPVDLKAHLQRLWKTAALFDASPLFDEKKCRRLISKLLQRSGLKELWINFIVTPGRYKGGVFGAARPTWVILARRLKLPDASAYEKGVAAVSFQGRRFFPEWKTTHYLPGYAGLKAAEEKGAAEAFYIDPRGFYTEGVTSNITVISKGKALYPVEGCLPGLTQKRVRELSEPLGLSWRAARIRPKDLERADEVWITSSIRELLPVVRVDGKKIGKGKPGVWAKRLMPLYREDCRRRALEQARI